MSRQSLVCCLLGVQLSNLHIPVQWVCVFPGEGNMTSWLCPRHKTTNLNLTRVVQKGIGNNHQHCIPGHRAIAGLYPLLQRLGTVSRPLQQSPNECAVHRRVGQHTRIQNLISLSPASANTGSSPPMIEGVYFSIIFPTLTPSSGIPTV